MKPSTTSSASTLPVLVTFTMYSPNGGISSNFGKCAPVFFFVSSSNVCSGFKETSLGGADSTAYLWMDMDGYGWVVDGWMDKWMDKWTDGWITTSHESSIFNTAHGYPACIGGSLLLRR